MRNTVTAGLVATLSVIGLLWFMPQLMGNTPINITQDIGVAFSVKQPYFAGSVFLLALGIFWAAVYGAIQTYLPGNVITKGIVFGFLVGLVSISMQPYLLGLMDNMIGDANQYIMPQTTWTPEVLMTILGYVGFGIVMTAIYRNTDATGSI